jgi:hypothetical protein
VGKLMLSLPSVALDPQTNDEFRVGWFALVEDGGDGLVAVSLVEQILTCCDPKILCELRDHNKRRALDVATPNIKKMLQSRLHSLCTP